MKVPENVVSKVVDTTDTTTKLGIKVECIDRIVCEIGVKRNHFTMLREARLLRVRLEELQEELEKVGRRLAELDIEMLYRNSTFHPITNYKIQIVKQGE